MTRLRVILILSVLAIASTASAQAVPTAWKMKIYLTGAAAPISTVTYPLAQVTCAIPPALTTSTVNPDKFEWDDPFNGPGLVCRWTDPGTGQLASTPVSTTGYQGTITAISGTVESAESARVSFTQPAPVVLPRVPTGFRAIR